MYSIALLLHVLAATVWTGGHIVLATTILPRALKTKDVEFLRTFERGYEKVGIPALIIQVTTGFYMANSLLADHSLWLDWSHPVGKIISLKLGLLLLTALLAVDARLRIIPKLSQDNIKALAWHIIPVTVVSILFVFVGVSLKTGWLA
ncbi:MAG: CopD family protein [Psychrobium sp.]